jgi:uncharacterized protein (DUF58 family)
MALAALRFTTRGAGALTGALLVLVLAFYSTNILLFLIAVFLLGLVLSSLLTFAYSTRGFGPEAFEVERVECSSLVKVGGAGLVSARLTSRLPTGFYAEVRDPHSERLRVLEGSDHLITWWPTRETMTLAYVVSPDLRGLLDVGPTVLVAHDVLGFAFKTVTFDDPWSIEALVQPPSLPIGHPVRLASNVVGQTSLAARGAGSDFHGLREYDPTDEFRHIAWSRSTQGTLYVREYERESQQDLIALVDTGRGMATGAGYENALEESIAAAARALRVAFDEGGRGGVVLFADDVQKFVPPGRGSGAEFDALRALTDAEIHPEPSSLAVALRFLLTQLKRPASLLVFTSPGDDPAKIAAESAALRHAGHRIYALVPDVETMYRELPDVSQQDAFRAVLQPAARRARSVTDALARSGAAVAAFGRDGAVEAVARLFARDPRASGGV